MSIRAKVLSGFIAILFLFVGVSLYNYHRARLSNARLAFVNQLFLPLSRQVAQLQSNIQGLAEDNRRFYFQPDVSSEHSTFSRMVRDLYPYLVRKKFTSIDELLTKHDPGPLKAVVQELQAVVTHARTTFDEFSSTPEREKFETLYRQLRGQLQTQYREANRPRVPEDNARRPAGRR